MTAFDVVLTITSMTVQDPDENLFPKSGEALAVLVSGGLDSAILVGEALQRGIRVHPLYVRHGLYWEQAELAHLNRFLERLAEPALNPLHVLEMPVADVYESHWSLTGQAVPDADTPDEAVFLPGRNVLLLSKAILWCHLHRVPSVALAPLTSNPFPDATAEFFHAYESIVNRAIEGRVRVVRPYSRLNKREVMLRGKQLPLELTFSCIHPINGHHCGKCNKCAERRLAFRDAQLTDATVYETE
jgi:7-cyano-7-deazaguanine synthase